MARRNSGQEEEGGSWMDTYGDMVTLILTFFVLLYSMSSINEQKYQLIAQAFSSKGQVINTVVAGEHAVENPTGNLIEDAQLNAGESPETFDQLYQYLTAYVEDNNLSESIEIEKGPANVYLKFRDNIFFEPDQAFLLPVGAEVLDGISPGIKAVNKYILGIRIHGHTAAAENSDVNDRDLSTGRANAVLKYLESKDLCPNNKLSASGFGKYRPIAENDTEENMRKNRRVEIIIARNDVNWQDPAVIQEFFQIEYGSDFILPTNENSDSNTDNQEITPDVTQATPETESETPIEPESEIKTE